MSSGRPCLCTKLRHGGHLGESGRIYLNENQRRVLFVAILRANMHCLGLNNLEHNMRKSLEEKRKISNFCLCFSSVNLATLNFL